MKKVDLGVLRHCFSLHQGALATNVAMATTTAKKAIDLISKTATQIEQDGIRKKKLKAAQIHCLFDVLLPLPL